MYFFLGYLATEFSRKVSGESDGRSKAIVPLDKDLFAGHLGYPFVNTLVEYYFSSLPQTDK